MRGLNTLEYCPNLWHVDNDGLLRSEVPEETALVGHADDISTLITARNDELALKLKSIGEKERSWTYHQWQHSFEEDTRRRGLRDIKQVQPLVKRRHGEVMATSIGCTKPVLRTGSTARVFSTTQKTLSGRHLSSWYILGEHSVMEGKENWGVLRLKKTGLDLEVY
ncbi:hypothetical protein J6590_001928 [Homalodisca vitripennis]|nr:hypothetical protein J6590_001928 [Homalodisca vitripennis]